MGVSCTDGSGQLSAIGCDPADTDVVCTMRPNVRDGSSLPKAWAMRMHSFNSNTLPVGGSPAPEMQAALSGPPLTSSMSGECPVDAFPNRQRQGSRVLANFKELDAVRKG